MGNVIDLTGKRFGRWIVIECVGRNKSGGAMWHCKCDCGTERNVDGRSLRDGVSKSCGCYGAERRLESCAKAARTHGGKNERLYNVWNGMKDRCNNPKSKFYHRYGARGIKVCDEWLDYAVFREWAFRTGYDPTAQKGKCTIDRINNDKGYSPDNCRWVSSKEQCNNKGTNHILSFNGQSHTITEWAEKCGIRKDTLRRRIVVYGWEVSRALTEPCHRK